VAAEQQPSCGDHSLMAAASAGGSDEDLLAALHAAPTHGFNARELLLSVARDPSLSNPQDAAGEQPESADRAQMDKPSNEALWSALPPSERPMVRPSALLPLTHVCKLTERTCAWLVCIT